MINWIESTLGDICQKITDGAHLSPPSVKHGMPMASVKDLTPHGITIQAARQINPEDYERLCKQDCKPQIGDVLIAKDWATALDTVCLIKDKIEVVLLSSIAILRPNQSLIEPAFLRYYLDSSKTRDYMKAAFTTGAAIPRVVLKDFKRALIKYPPLPTQRRIASILSAYDDLIENNTRRIAILEEMARRLYREWFVDFRFPGHEKVRMKESELGLIPKGWEVAQLKEIASVNAKSIKPKTAPQSINYIDISSVSPGKVDKITFLPFSDAPSRARRKVNPGDILWSCVRPNRRSHVLMVNPLPNTIASTGFAVISARSVPNSFLYQAVTTDDFVDYLVNRATGAAYPAVKQEDFKTAKVVVPPSDILHHFTQLAAPQKLLVQNLMDKNTNLRTQRDLLLPKLISGEIDVSELKQPSAEEIAA